MAESQHGTNPFASPAAARGAEPSRRDAQIGPGYFLIILVNCLGLAFSYFPFVGIGDGWAQVGATILAAPFMLAQVFLGLVPAWIYFARNVSSLNKLPLVILLALSIIATLVQAIGWLLVLLLPAAGGC